MTTAADGEVRAAVIDAAVEARGVLEELVRIPSISASPEHAGDVDAVIARVAELAAEAGAATTEIVRSGGGQPALIASWTARAGGGGAQRPHRGWGPAPGGPLRVHLAANAGAPPPGPRAGGPPPPFEPI